MMSSNKQNNKLLWFFALIATFLTVSISVYFGALNQDEGWYLYAARLSHEGYKLYADFAFTQGPLLPKVYGAFYKLWSINGILSARIFTIVLGLCGILIACALASRLVKKEEKAPAFLITFSLLACNLYHIYYLTIPKTYALTSLFLLIAFYLLSLALEKMRARHIFFVASGFFFAMSASVRTSLFLIPAIILLAFLISEKKRQFFASFLFGLVAGFALTFYPILTNEAVLNGFIEANIYHISREGVSPFFIAGSVSRLVRWYLPIFILAVWGLFFFIKSKNKEEKDRNEECDFLSVIILISFVATFLLHIVSPHPYDDYQVPIMALGAILATVFCARVGQLNGAKILAVALACLCSGSSPLLEEWMTNGHDRFWTRVKKTSELKQLQDVAKRINDLDPDGENILTQDLYLAIETKRHVPIALAMGPFSILSNDEWRALLKSAPANIAALSGYTFAINPPRGTERALDEQLEFWSILKEQYSFVEKEVDFGQHATTLLILKRK